MPWVFEILSFLLVYVIAVVLAMPLRRGVKGERIGTSRRVSGLRRVTAYVARPLLVLLVGQCVVLLLRDQGTLGAWITEYRAHIAAWQLFWVGVLAIGLFEGVAHQIFVMRQRDFPIPDLLRDIIRVVLVLAVIFCVLRFELGIDIAPLLASTALVTAVVGFALQGVLGNLLAGMSLHVTGSINQGDWIAVGELEGKVIKTNWRETKILTRAGHPITIPNGKVAEANIHNMSRPRPIRRHAIEVGASYADAPDEVTRALIEAALSVPEVKRTPPPTAFITAYLDFGINYRLRFWSDNYYRRRPVEGNVNRMIWYKFKRRGIEIPFPMSDQLLNDFMAVVYNQRKQAPEDTEIEARIDDLLASDFCRKLVVDADGEPLLGRADFANIAPLVRRVLFTHGETLYVQGESGTTFHVLVSGVLEGSITQPDSDLVTSFQLSPGAVLGEMSLLTEMPRTATITVKESAQLLEFDLAAFRGVLSLRDEIPERLSELAAERAAQNKEAFAALAEQQAQNVEETIKKGNILKRLLRLIGK